MQPSLSFEQAPPVSVPFRFFLTAPLFGVGAGLLLLWQGGDVFISRWSPVALALTHLLALGFMLQAMCGALLQMLPVVVGANIWRPRTVAALTHGGLTLGSVLLVAGFLSESPWLFRLAAPVLGVGLGTFIVVVLIALIRTSARSPTVLALRLAVGGLAITLALGVTLASAFGWNFSLPLVELTHLHAAWGLLGWSLILVMGVALLVVPMFQLTPPYRPTLARGLPLGLAALLVLWSLALLWQWFLPARLFAVLTALLLATFGGVTLRLQAQRRRKIVEPTLLFWRAAMIALIAAAALAVVQWSVPAVGDYSGTSFLLAALMIVGMFPAVISGMLYKIVPFLNWMHLQNLGKPGPAVPNMKQMIPESRMRLQFRLHLAALLLCLLAVAWPPLAYGAGLALVASFGLLEWNLITGVRLYVRYQRALAAKA